jgi:predicted RNase H-like HicB family nuclease
VIAEFRNRRKKEGEVITYTFKVIVEPDEDRWHAYCPALADRGGATWGDTPEHAVSNLQEVVKMVVESLADHGEPIAPGGSDDAVNVSSDPLVAVTV